MEIYPFQEQHRPALRTIYLESRRRWFSWLDISTFDINDFDRDTKGEKIWVACENGKPVGFISVWTQRNFIHHLYVLPGYENRGIGGNLLAECGKHVGRPMRLKCMTKNVRAVKFYRKKGWVIESNCKSEHGKCYVMHFDG